MFTQIVESVINEISAEDAYAKFYNTIDKNIFDDIVAANKGKFDKLTRFVIDAVKNESIGYGDAKCVLRCYNQASNDIRVTIKSKFDSGEYESPIEILEDIDFYQKNGVITTKSIQNMGFGVIYETDTEKVTYTATYEANQHFYGQTKWCTASDRMGKYDGWYYFLYYVYGYTFTCTDEIKDEYLRGNLENYRATSILVQYINKVKNKTYQIQMHENGKVGQLCDENDDSENIGYIGITDEAFSAIKNNFTKILDLTNEGIKKESVYQLSKEGQLERKKRNKKKKIFDNLMQVFSVKRDLVKKESDKIFSSKLLSNKDFVQQLVYNYKEIPLVIERQAERIMKNQGYVNIDGGVAFKNGFCALLVKPCYGNMKEIDSDFSFVDVLYTNIDYEPFNFYNDDENTDDSIFNEFREYEQSKNFKSAIILAEASFNEIGFDGFEIDKINRIINVFSFDTANVRLHQCSSRGVTGGERAYSFYANTPSLPNIISYYKDGNMYLFSFVSGKLFDVGKEFNVSEPNIGTTRYFRCGDKFAMAFVTNSINQENQEIIDVKTLGGLIDNNLNLKKIYTCVNIQGLKNYTIVFIDDNNGDIFFASSAGFEKVGRFEKNQSITSFYYGGHMVYIENKNGKYKSVVDPI